jgi:hypothetical protein
MTMSMIAPRIRIPTGQPKFVDSSTIRLARRSEEAWSLMLKIVTRAAEANLDLLTTLDVNDEMVCPWKDLTTCNEDCRCNGRGMVSIGFLRDHLKYIVERIVDLTKPETKRVPALNRTNAVWLQAQIAELSERLLTPCTLTDVREQLLQIAEGYIPRKKR